MIAKSQMCEGSKVRAAQFPNLAPPEGCTRFRIVDCPAKEKGGECEFASIFQVWSHGLLVFIGCSSMTVKFQLCRRRDVCIRASIYSVFHCRAERSSDLWNIREVL